VEDSILVSETGESDLIDLMNDMLSQYPTLKLFSLPKSNQRRTTELGMKGESEQVKFAMATLKSSVTALGYPWTNI
jgi:molybdopterin-biosynthesis enzyme MoeA-like protein